MSAVIAFQPSECTLDHRPVEPSEKQCPLTVFNASDILNIARTTSCLFIPQYSKALVSDVRSHDWGDPRKYTGYGITEQDIIRLLVAGNVKSTEMHPNLLFYPEGRGDCIDLTAAVVEPWLDKGFKNFGISSGIVVSTISYGSLKRYWLPVDLEELRLQGDNAGLSIQTFCAEFNRVVARNLRGNGHITVQEIAEFSLRGPVQWFADTCVDC